MSNTFQHSVYISRDCTNIIKGTALILMFLHHFFTFPEWYIDSISYPYLDSFALYMHEPLKICVCAFAFLTGYFYFFNKNKTIKYSIRKCTDIWVTYILCFLVLLIPAIILNAYSFSLTNLILELIAIKRPTMFFCWYVLFYYSAMFILPLYSRLSKKSPILIFSLSVILPVFISYASNILLPESIKAVTQIFDYLPWFSCVSSGYVFAEYNLFEQFDNLINTNKKVINILLGAVFIVISMTGRLLPLNCDFIYAPFFVYGVVKIYNNIKFKPVFFPVSVLGKHSLLMWFLHCMFFNNIKSFTQPILFFPKNPILVTIWGLIICLSIALVINYPIEKLIKLKNKLFK